MARNKPVLTLSTLAPERPVIEIDGEQYEIAVAGDLGLVESAKLDALQPKILAYSRIKGQPSQKILEEMSVTFTTFVELIVLECAKSVTDKLNDSQRWSLIQVFTNAAASNVKPPTKRKRTTTRKT